MKRQHSNAGMRQEVNAKNVMAVKALCMAGSHGVKIGGAVHDCKHNTDWSDVV